VYQVCHELLTKGGTCVEQSWDRFLPLSRGLHHGIVCDTVQTSIPCPDRGDSAHRRRAAVRQHVVQRCIGADAGLFPIWYNPTHAKAEFNIRCIETGQWSELLQLVACASSGTPPGLEGG
jgi:hypothetical protein